jgi:hypothetical protein
MSGAAAAPAAPVAAAAPAAAAPAAAAPDVAVVVVGGGRGALPTECLQAAVALVPGRPEMLEGGYGSAMGAMVVLPAGTTGDNVC